MPVKPCVTDQVTPMQTSGVQTACVQSFGAQMAEFIHPKSKQVRSIIWCPNHLRPNFRRWNGMCSIIVRPIIWRPNGKCPIIWRPNGKRPSVSYPNILRPKGYVETFEVLTAWAQTCSVETAASKHNEPGPMYDFTYISKYIKIYITCKLYKETKKNHHG